MASVDLDQYELDLLCDACDSYIEDLKSLPKVIGAMERAEHIREKLRTASNVEQPEQQ